MVNTNVPADAPVDPGSAQIGPDQVGLDKGFSEPTNTGRSDVPSRDVHRPPAGSGDSRTAAATTIDSAGAVPSGTRMTARCETGSRATSSPLTGVTSRPGAGAHQHHREAVAEPQCRHHAARRIRSPPGLPANLERRSLTPEAAARAGPPKRQCRRKRTAAASCARTGGTRLWRRGPVWKTDPCQHPEHGHRDQNDREEQTRITRYRGTVGLHKDYALCDASGRRSSSVCRKSSISSCVLSP